jgi:hypothetical protein
MIKAFFEALRDIAYGIALSLILFGLAVLFFKAGIQVQG